VSSRVYVCHTFYHVYIACLKEFYRGADGDADLILSKMSNKFGTMVERAKECPVFKNVYEYDEKRPEFFPELDELKTDTGNIVSNMRNRIRFCKAFGKRQEKFVPVDLKQYKDIYVFCDSDPIGYYLNYKKIRYHALEDGLDCIRYYDTARYDNRGHFKIKAAMAALGLIHIQNGYGKYCIDMEVNDISVLEYPCKKYVELRRTKLTDALTQDQKDIMLKLFVSNLDELNSRLKESAGRKTMLILSEPLCSLDVRERIFRDIIAQYGEGYLIMIKQHPRDELDYKKLFADCILLDGTFPMEMLNFIEGLNFDRVVSVYTVVDSIRFAKEKIFLGDDFMDIYEAPEIHRQNEYI